MTQNSVHIYQDGDEIAVYCETCIQGIQLGGDEGIGVMAANERNTDTSCDECGHYLPADNGPSSGGVAMNSIDFYKRHYGR